MKVKFVSKRVLRPLTRGLIKLPRPILRILAGKPVRIDNQELDLHCQFIGKYFGYSPRMLESVGDVRQEYDHTGDLLGHDPAKGVAFSEFTLQGPHGAIPCEMHFPTNLGKGAPALIYYHGGGHVMGSLVTHRAACRQLSVEAHCAVIAVDYRLAPDHKFPVGVEDALAAYDEIVKRAEKLNINPRRIAVGGESAGGNLAAVVAQQRKDSQCPPYHQLLIVPWLDMSKQAPSYELFSHGFHLTRYFMQWYTSHYLNTKADASNPLASPLLGDSKGVCAASVLVAGFDPLRDEGIAYAEKLKASGVQTEFKKFDNLIHPYMNFAGHIPAAKSAFSVTSGILRDALYKDA